MGGRAARLAFSHMQVVMLMLMQAHQQAAVNDVLVVVGSICKMCIIARGLTSTCMASV